jgi:putative transposase
MNFISYKGVTHNRRVEFINGKKTTMTCFNCLSETGPTGWSGLAVRYWVCSVCGTQHDRDINSAKLALNIGLGCSLETTKVGLK